MNLKRQIVLLSFSMFMFFLACTGGKPLKSEGTNNTSASTSASQVQIPQAEPSIAERVYNVLNIPNFLNPLPSAYALDVVRLKRRAVVPLLHTKGWSNPDGYTAVVNCAILNVSDIYANGVNGIVPESEQEIKVFTQRAVNLTHEEKSQTYFRGDDAVRYYRLARGESVNFQFEAPLPRSIIFEVSDFGATGPGLVQGKCAYWIGGNRNDAFNMSEPILGGVPF